MGPNFKNGTGTDGWMTPKPFIEMAREVMGSIDLDPASSDQANMLIRARTFYCSKDSALLHTWHGNIWLNPPYSAPLQQQFADKLTSEVAAGRVDQAVVLVNAKTETKWFRTFAGACPVMCLPSKRIAFISPVTGEPVKGNNNSQAIMYFGPNVDVFVRVFSEIGMVYERVDNE